MFGKAIDKSALMIGIVGCVQKEKAALQLL